MIREHDEEVLARARQMDGARAAGLAGDQLMELVAARNLWHRIGHIPAQLLTPTLAAAAATDAAMIWDAVFTARLREQLRKLSVLPSSVRP